MAKKKSPPKKGAEDRPPSQVFGKQQPLIAQLRGSLEWKQWLKDLARHNRQTVAGVIDTALARLAREIDFREPPER